MLGKLIAAHRSHDHSLPQQLFKYFLALADADQNEIGLARHKLESHLGEFSLQVLESLAVDLQAVTDVVGIVQRRQRAPLGRRIDIERLAHALHQTDQLLWRNAVTDAQTRQSVQFGKRPQREYRAALRVIAQRIRIAAVLHVFEIGLINDDQYVARDLADKALPLVAAVNRSGRIVRIGQKNNPGLRCNRSGDGP